MRPPPGTWDASRAEALEKALDGFFAESDAARRAEIFGKELLPREVGLALEELEEIAGSLPPEGGAGRRGPRGVRRVECPWLDGNPRGWFNIALPEGYTPRKSWGLVVALHGAGADGRNVTSFYSPQMGRLGFLVVYPTTTKASNMWHSRAEIANVYRIVEWAARRYRIDFRRLVVTGGSMGGMGTWSHVLARPEVWSAAASVAGHPAAMAGDVLEKLRGVPFYILHGEKDTAGASLAPVENVRKAVEELRRRGIDHVYVEAPGAGHTPPRKYWAKMNEWIAEQAPKARSPRPLFLPPKEKRPLWKEAADPLGIAEDPALALVKEGKAREAKSLLDARIRKGRSDARTYLLRAAARIGALLEPFPRKIDAETFKAGWNVLDEKEALRDLARVLRTRSAGRELKRVARMMRLKILAKRVIVAVRSRGYGWVRVYQAFTREVKALLASGPADAEVAWIVQSVTRRLPMMGARSK